MFAGKNITNNKKTDLIKKGLMLFVRNRCV